ncbi:hypothetical protein [Dendrosporobacter sp. 1207_IL3150]|uniref:hypothetical protein n=1 Tax=Dendrosporobacter sp. 1207_IL3150 TaxID=3084054 RepID=UPI002FD9E882
MLKFALNIGYKQCVFTFMPIAILMIIPLLFIPQIRQNSNYLQLFEIIVATQAIVFCFVSGRIYCLLKNKCSD